MKTIEYKLKSSHETSVLVPSDYVDIAEKIIEEAKHFQNDIPLLVRDQYMINQNITTNVARLIENHQSSGLYYWNLDYNN